MLFTAPAQRICGKVCGMGSSATLSAKRLESHLKTLLGSLMACQTKIDDRTACNVFVARGLRLCYHRPDFCIPPTNPKADEDYVSANEIANRAAEKWGFIGTGAQQSNLNQAQDYANNGRPVIAVRAAHGHGHVCLILPGELTASGTWGMDVPNSASFCLDSIAGCYIGRPLSYAFGPDKKSTVLLYHK